MSSPYDQTGFRIRLYKGEPHPCPYLPARTAEDQFALVDDLAPRDYQMLMDHGFRRSGRIVYRAACDGCIECVPIRVPVARFEPTRSQRRALRKNRDVKMEMATPVATDEKFSIYRAYLEYQHDGMMNGDRASFERFLYESPTHTWEMVYRIEGRIVGVGIVDQTPKCLSSVYFFFDPAFGRRSLGVYSALVEIDECRRRGLEYWYAGYYIRGCDRMNYKADYKPFELLTAEGTWRESM